MKGKQKYLIYTTAILAIVLVMVILVTIFKDRESLSANEPFIENDTNRVSKKNVDESTLPRVFYLTDTSKAKFPYVKFTLLDTSVSKHKCVDGSDSLNYKVEWGTEKDHWTAKLSNLIRDPRCRIPPNLEWINDSYICVGTWWSGPHWQALFLPLKPELKVKFIPHTIVYTDTTDNFICYYDRNGMEEHPTNIDCKYWTIEGLISNKKLDFRTYSCYPNDDFPYFDSIKRQDNYLMIWQSCNALPKKISIREYIEEKISK